MIHLPRILEAAELVQSFCNEQKWQFCIIGGIAVQRWGEPRLTLDVDLTLLTGFGSEERFAAALLEAFHPRIAKAREFALQNRVLLLQTGDGTNIDIAFGAVPFEERAVSRSSNWTWAEGHCLRTCSAEDLVIHKVFAGRDRDWADTEGILARQMGHLNMALIHQELDPLLTAKEDPAAWSRFETLLAATKRKIG